MKTVKCSVAYGGFEYPSELSLPEHRIFKSRNDLPEILNILGLVGEGVEVGILLGEYSEIILKGWQGKRLHSVDPWKCFNDSSYMDDALVSQEEQDRNYESTCARLAAFGERSSILRMTSDEAASRFSDGSLDFVYIDAQHQYDAVKVDLALWYPKVKKGGMFGGHDFFNIDHNGKNIFGVRRAVEEMCAEKKLEFYVSVDDLSWFVLIS